MKHPTTHISDAAQCSYAHRVGSGPVALTLVTVALTLLAVAPAAQAFQTRTPLGSFGLEGAGSCAGLAQVSGTGDVSGATGIGDMQLLASGTATRASGSNVLTGVTTTSGSFAVGESISGSGIPAGATIAGVDTGTATLTLSANATSSGSAVIRSGSKTITDVASVGGDFAAGWEVSSSGIPDGTTITAVDTAAGTVTLSAGVTIADRRIFRAGSTEVTNVAADCGSFAVGQVIAGEGIRNNTTIEAIGAGTITLTHPRFAEASGVSTPLTASLAFGSAGDLAVDQAAGRLFVDDAGPLFSGEDGELHAFDTTTHAPVGGPFPLDLKGATAIDNTAGSSAGNIYRLDGSSIKGFDSTGAPLGGSFPAFVSNGPGDIAVDSTGTIWVATASVSNDFLATFDSTGKKLTEIVFSKGNPRALAFDSNNDLYVSVDSPAAGQSGIWRYTAASGYTAGTRVVPYATGDYAVSLAIDRSTDTIYAAERFGPVSPSSASAYDASGDKLYELGVIRGGARSIAVNESVDLVYLTGGDGVDIYGDPAEFADATVVPQPATAVTTTTAILHATLDDNNALPTRASFQLSKDNGTTWTGAGSCGIPIISLGGQSSVAIHCIATNLQSGTDYLVRVVTEKGGGSEQAFSATESFQTIALPPASAVCDQAATNVTATSADLECTLDDENEFPTNWRFQVSKDEGDTWTDTDVSGETAGNESGVLAAGTAEDLDPNSEYRFRLSTSKGPGAADTNFEGPAPFITLLTPPVLSGVGAYGVTDVTAHLAGEVNPRNAQTSYEFKYGTSPGNLDSSTPATDIPAGLDTVVVAQELTGLAPDADYHFKLVAANGAGTVESAVETLHTRAEPPPDDHPGDCANDDLREAQGSFHLPDCRAYEMVTPPEKNFADLGINGGDAAWDGGAVRFSTQAVFGNGQIGFQGTQYVSRRGAGGWSTRWATERSCVRSGSRTNPVGSSPNFDRLVIVIHEAEEGENCSVPPLDPAAPPGQNNYLADYGAEPPTFDLLPGADGARLGENPDQAVYASTSRLTPEAPAGSFDKLYEWNDGTIALLSKDTANAPFATASSLPPAGFYAISASGARVFFANGGEVYMRQTGSITYEVSESECSSACGADSPDSFNRATPDGSKALLTSAAKLTNDDTSSSGDDLFRYAHSANPAANANLTLLSRDSEPADGTASGLLGVLGMSEDGNTVFFAASGQLVAGEPTAPGPKLYRWRANGGSPTLEYLATVEGAAASQWNGGSSRRSITPDGARLFLYGPMRLVPGADHDSDSDIYRWQQAGGWECLSCQLPETPSAGNPTAFAGEPLAFSDDGERAFFSSPDSLLAADENEGVRDVYQWHEGSLSLLSTGTAAQDSDLLGAARDGEDVFLRTRERLVGWDTDDNMDIYDARVGGGFPEPASEPAQCEGESCRGRGSDSPLPAGAGSAVFSGPGNPAAGGGKKPRGCAKAARSARKQARAAKRLRRAAVRSSNPRQSRRLRRRAARFARAAKKNTKRARRCRRANRRAGR